LQSVLRYGYDLRGMNLKNLVSHHRLFVTFFVLCILVAVVDIFNIDSMFYKNICAMVAQYVKIPCVDFYDIPIWNMYLILAVLTALYHVHDEIRTTNKHLSAKK